MSLALRDGRPIGGDGVTQQKAVVEKFTDGLALVGKDAFEVEAAE
jgi:hypothetical protein